MKDSAEVNHTNNSRTDFITQPTIDPINELFPYCIVWSPLSFITLLFPFLGHIGVCTSKGVIYDIGGVISYKSSLAYYNNTPIKYLFIKPSNNQSAKDWDDTVENVHMKYKTLDCNLFINNSYSYCAYVLNEIKYNGRNNYTFLDIFIMMTFHSKYITPKHLFKNYKGFFMLMLSIVIFVAQDYCIETYR